MTNATIKLIKAELKLAEVTERELAEFMEITEEEVMQILSGQRKISVNEGIAIAQFFDLDPMLILGGK